MVLFRNLFIAPVTEELCFRGLMVPILFHSFCTQNSYPCYFVAIVCPLFFGLAHINHFFEQLYNGITLQMLLVQTLVQIAYTTVFGVMAAFFLMRTGNICSPILSHAICNLVGLPDMSFMSPPKSFHASFSSFLYPIRTLVFVLHGLGLLLFAYSFSYFTDSLVHQSSLWVT